MTNKSYKLSLCIPTHNRVELLKKTLNSILNQIKIDNNDVEIVVLDSASNDGTKELIHNLKKKYDFINYKYNKKKRGIDVDLNESVNLSNGEYCWLVSDDDPHVKNSLKIIKRYLENDHGIYLCSNFFCDKDLNILFEKHWLNKNAKKSYYLNKRSDLKQFLENSNGLASLFSYMSTIIFKREEWMQTEFDNNFSSSGYAHVVRLFDMIKNDLSLYYISEPLLYSRGFNDSFLSLGIKKRFMLDIDGYTNIFKRCFNQDDNIIRDNFFRVLRMERPWYQLIKLKRYSDGKSDWKEIKNKLVYCGYDKCKIKIAEIISLSNFLVDFLVYFKYKINTTKFKFWKL